MLPDHESIDGRWADKCTAELIAWGLSNSPSYPWRRRMPLWQGLVAEVLLQRTRAQQVIPVFQTFLSRYGSAAAFGAASEREILDLVAPLGLKWRGQLLVRLSREVGTRRGRLSRRPQELKLLPGVGDYVASAALSFHAGIRAPIIDSNVVRVLSRLTGTPYDGETRRKSWIKALSERMTPHAGFQRYNYALLDLAMLVCLTTRPRCEECPLRPFCVTGRASPRTA